MIQLLYNFNLIIIYNIISQMRFLYFVLKILERGWKGYFLVIDRFLNENISEIEFSKPKIVLHEVCIGVRGSSRSDSESAVLKNRSTQKT